MTAITTITQISSENICLNEGDVDVRVLTGFLAASTYPGEIVYFDEANNQWVKYSTSAGGATVTTIGVVGYRKRVDPSTGAVKRITDAYDPSKAEDKMVSIITSGVVIAKIVDQGGAKPAGSSFGASSTAGALTIITVGTTQEVATLARLAEDDDLFAIIGIGKCKGKLWGGKHG